ncbi:MAG: transglutaminase-like cysteine peptidase [Burkholderiaceae bacterium]
MGSHSGRGHSIAALALCGCELCHSAWADETPAGLPAVERVNLTLNHRIVFADDASNWGQADHWATPDELLARGAGDCEDFAIAKYFALRAAGLPAAQLRLVYTQLRFGGTGDVWRPHMVLAFLPADAAGEELILDNVLDEIRPLSRRPDLRALISFNTDGIWRALERGEPARPASRLAPWARVLQRMASPH